MKDLVSFRQLNHETQTVIAKKIHQLETETKDTFYVHDIVTEKVKVFFERNGIQAESILCSYNGTGHFRAEKAYAHKGFIESHLTESELSLYQQLEVVSMIPFEPRVFLDDEDDFTLSFSYFTPGSFPVALELIKQHGTPEEKDEFAFLGILTDETTSEEDLGDAQYGRLTDVTERVCSHLLEGLLIKLDEAASVLRNETETLITKEFEYYYSHFSYLDRLKEDDDHLLERYAFDASGHVRKVSLAE